MAEVYCICFPNGKLYVGFTTLTTRKRFWQHAKSAYLVGRAIRKYGPENCRIVALRSNVSTTEAKKLERWYIKKLRSRLPGGYNQTNGGDGVAGLRMSEAARMKMSTAHKGRLHTPEHRCHIGEANKGRRCTIRMRRAVAKANHQRSVSSETRAKMSDSQRIRYERERQCVRTAG